MKRKVIPVIIIMSAMIATSTASFFMGKQVEGKEILIGKQEQAKEEEATKIAVINQDSGTNYKDKNVNYAVDFFNSLGDDYEITDREAAQKGIEDGKYGAMIVIPGNFSKNITTINEVTPSKVKIYYELNKELSNENQLIVSGKIGEFEKKLNNKLSYMYVSSVFDEVHNGQDYASDILKNDDTDMQAINSINDSDILESIDLTTVDDKDIKFNDLDLSKDFDESKGIVSDIDHKYRDEMGTKESNLENIKNELVDVIGNGDTGIQSFTTRLKKMNQQELKDEFADRHKYNYEGLTNNYNVNVSDINSYLENLTKDNGEIDQLVDKYEKEILPQINEKGTSAIKKSTESFNNIEEDADSDADILKSDSISNLEHLKKNIEERNQDDPKMQSLNEEYLLYGQMISKLKQSNPAMFDNIYNQVVNDNNVNYNKILKNPSEDSSEGNSFADSNELKQYINDGINEQNENSVSSRSDKYKHFSKSDEKNDDNISNINDTIDDLDKVQKNLKEISSSTHDIINDKDYRYIDDIFNQNADKPLNERLQIKDELINKIKDSIGGDSKKQLVSTIQKNNTENVDSVKGTVQKEVEKVIEDDGPIDVGDVIKDFEKNYMSRFNNIITHVSGINKTPSKVEDDKEMTDLFDKFNKSNENLNTKVTKQLEDYNKEVEEISDQADKHVSVLQDDLDKGIEASQNKISSGLAGVKETKKNTSSSNKEKLDSLTNVLSNSRVGTVENTDMYNFMISPVSAVENKELAGKLVKPQQNDNKIRLLVVSFSIMYFCTLWIIAVVYRRRKKVNANK